MGSVYILVNKDMPGLIKLDTRAVLLANEQNNSHARLGCQVHLSSL